MNTISGGGVFSARNISDINANFLQLYAGFTPGNIIYLNTASSNLGPQDGSVNAPYSDIVSAFGAARNAMNDVIVLVGNGATSATARTTAAFTWNKDAVHLVGVASPSIFFQRARIAPTSTAMAFANFFTVSGNGCYFKNISWFAGFGTGTTSAIAMTVTGSRNVFQNCSFMGMVDTASAASTGSRSLKIGSAGSGENVFESCQIGTDTFTRAAVNASLELAGATPRNVFRDCFFPVMTSDAGALTILGTGNECVDRENYFVRCIFANAIKSTSTGQTAVASFTTASPGGALVLQQCMAMGATKWGDTNALANTYIDMAAPSQAAGGLGVTPS